MKYILTFIASILKYWIKSFDYKLIKNENNQRIISSKIISRKFDKFDPIY